MKSRRILAAGLVEREELTCACIVEFEEGSANANYNIVKISVQ